MAYQNTLTLYHGTTGVFDRFREDPSGLHFGTLDQAAHRATQRLAELPAEAFMALPVRKGWRGVVLECIVGFNRCKRVDDLGSAGHWSRAIEQAKAEGFDALMYRNDFEGREDADAIVVFSPDQVVSIAPHCP